MNTKEQSSVEVPTVRRMLGVPEKSNMIGNISGNMADELSKMRLDAAQIAKLVEYILSRFGDAVDTKVLCSLLSKADFPEAFRVIEQWKNR